MKNTALIFILIILATGCSALQVKPYEDIPEGAEIKPNSLGGYSLIEYRNVVSVSNVKSDVLNFCYAQNIPNLVSKPTLNPRGDKVTAAGREQVTFIVPRTFGTTLNYDLLFNVTTTTGEFTEILFDNLKVKGTWSANENPFPGTSEAKDYINSAIEKMDIISKKLSICFNKE